MGGEPRRRQLVLPTAVAQPVPGVRGTSIVVLVGLAAEDGLEGLRQRLSHGSLHLLVPVLERPAAMVEAAARVLVGPPGDRTTPWSLTNRVRVSFRISESFLPRAYLTF
jgi:hypothetical protein